MRHQRSSSQPPPDATRTPFPPRSPRRSSANAAGGGLKPPPAGRLRRANLHLSCSTASRNLRSTNQLLSAFVTQMVTLWLARSYVAPQRREGYAVVPPARRVPSRRHPQRTEPCES